MLFQLGAITFDRKVDAEATDEDFGGDFAVKAVVGARQPREFTGPSDHKFTLNGELLPYFHNRIGIGSGLDEVATLKAMAESGEPQILVRGDGTNMGWWLIEKGSLKSTRLSSQGIGHQIHYSLNLVESPVAASSGSLLTLLTQLFA